MRLLSPERGCKVISELAAIFFAVLGGIVCWVITEENLRRNDRD
jgi:hypothetical protein